MPACLDWKPPKGLVKLTRVREHLQRQSDHADWDPTLHHHSICLWIQFFSRLFRSHQWKLLKVRAGWKEQVPGRGYWNGILLWILLIFSFDSPLSEMQDFLCHMLPPPSCSVQEHGANPSCSESCENPSLNPSLFKLFSWVFWWQLCKITCYGLTETKWLRTNFRFLDGVTWEDQNIICKSNACSKEAGEDWTNRT